VPRRLIYSGIDADLFRQANPLKVRAELQISPDCLVVAIISKLWEGKGHQVLFEAWKKIQDRWRTAAGPKPKLLVVGEGPLDAALRQSATALNIATSVVFTGFRSDIPDVTAAIDVAVLPSAFEGMGRVVLEALAAGKPVVASRVGGIPDLIRHGDNGFLVPPNEVSILADSIELLLRDSRLRKVMAASAASSLERKHTASAMVEDIHAFYDEVAALKTER
jgi:glycosyltransferase involved in cell wall biosynthesis